MQKWDLCPTRDDDGYDKKMGGGNGGEETTRQSRRCSVGSVLFMYKCQNRRCMSKVMG